MAFAGNLAYHGMLAVVPLLVLVLSLLGAFNAEHLLESAIGGLEGAVPSAAIELLDEQLGQIAATQNPGVFGVGAALAAAVSLWAVSGGVRSLMEALNVMHDVQERRSLVRRYLMSLAVALGLAATLILSLGLIVLDPDTVRRVADHLDAGTAAALVWTWLRWPVVIVVVATALGVTYRLVPNLEQPFRPWSIGTLVATAGWLVFSLGFSLYVDSFGSYDATWGAAAGVVVFTLYVHWTSIIVLLGAQIDHTLRSRAA